MSVPRLAVVCDYREENWPSMDLVAEMLLGELQQHHASSVAATRIIPPMRRRFTRHSTRDGKLFNADRLLNRFGDYPRLLRRRRAEFDLFHVIDHSYAQLVHALPAERTVVTCHDIDTFRCLFDGSVKHRSFLFRSMTRRILSGLRRAARVTCDSEATRAELLAYELVAPERASVVPLGVHPSCSPETDSLADEEAARVLGRAGAGSLEILNVGSTVPRKRMDVLLAVFASVRKEFPHARLVRVGGSFTPEQTRLAEQLGVARAIVVLPHVSRNLLAAIYRRAAVVLQPSEREGFGLPVAEALACGTPVVASDLPVLREVGGAAALYCPVGDVRSWAETVMQLLVERETDSTRLSRRRAAGIVRASTFSWAECAGKMCDVYRQLL